MRKRLAVVVSMAAVLAVTATTAVAVTMTVDDAGDQPGVRRGTMSAPWHDQDGDRSGWHQRGSMMSGMPGMMYGVRVDSEYRYLADMVAHHQEAVESARQLQRSDRAQMRAFGESIVASQSAQIEQMQQWLADWYPDESGRVDYQPMMRDLSGLTGDRLDRAFLKDMTMHHMAAVMMSQQALARGVIEHPEVAVLARSIRYEQHAELFQMQRWLGQWFGQSWQHGPNRWDDRRDDRRDDRWEDRWEDRRGGWGMHRDGGMGSGTMRHGMMG